MYAKWTTQKKKSIIETIKRSDFYYYFLIAVVDVIHWEYFFLSSWILRMCLFVLYRNENVNQSNGSIISIVSAVRTKQKVGWIIGKEKTFEFTLPTIQNVVNVLPVRKVEVETELVLWQVGKLLTIFPSQNYISQNSTD